MKAPAFWTENNWRAAALAPASWVYDATSRWLRSRKPQYRAPVPVICVGNLTVGGTGKTPTVIALLQNLIERGLSVHVVSRGYGGSESGPTLVEIGKHNAAQVGDEPLLIASYAPIWVAKDRAAGVRAAAEAGAEFIVLDDGHQNPSVEKDLSLIVVDALYGFGNERVLPAGPLRETITAGMKRADSVMLIGEPSKPWPETFHGKPVLKAVLQPRFSGISLDGARVLAFAGIGRPEKFYETVKGQGATIVDRETFADHQTYTRPIIDRLMARADAQDLMIVTTEKDAVKLPEYTRGKIWPIPVSLVISDMDKFNIVQMLSRIHLNIIARLAPSTMRIGGGLKDRSPLTCVIAAFNSSLISLPVLWAVAGLAVHLHNSAHPHTVQFHVNVPVALGDVCEFPTATRSRQRSSA